MITGRIINVSSKTKCVVKLICKYTIKYMNILFTIIKNNKITNYSFKSFILYFENVNKCTFRHHPYSTIDRLAYDRQK